MLCPPGGRDDLVMPGERQTAGRYGRRRSCPESGNPSAVHASHWGGSGEEPSGLRVNEPGRHRRARARRPRTRSRATRAGRPARRVATILAGWMPPMAAECSNQIWQWSVWCRPEGDVSVALRWHGRCSSVPCEQGFWQWPVSWSCQIRSSIDTEMTSQFATLATWCSFTCDGRVRADAKNGTSSRLAAGGSAGRLSSPPPSACWRA